MWKNLQEKKNYCGTEWHWEYAEALQRKVATVEGREELYKKCEDFGFNSVNWAGREQFS